MLHETTLIATIAAAFVLAFALGFAVSKLKLPPLVGYLLAGVLIGPFTPGYVGDIGLATQLAEIGVMLLMFGVGLHFSVKDLMAVRTIAIPGAIAQIATATAIGAGMAHFWGWSLGAGLVFGLSLSVASTVVLLRALESRGTLDSADGRIAVGWLIVEDLVMVLALVLLPALSEALGGRPGGLAGTAAAASAGRSRSRSRRSRCSSGSRWSSARASCPGCSPRWPARAHASCSRSACSRSRSGSPSARRSCSACRSRWARSSPA